jgi:tetratricopeptide (TPR) repeat protein
MEQFRELKAKEDAQARAAFLESAARASLEEKGTAEAIRVLRELYEARPDGVSARNLGLALLQNGDVLSAKHYLEKALELSPRDPPTHNYLGLLDANQGDLATALSQFETAARLDPSYREAEYNAGVAAARLNRHPTSLQHLLAAMHLSDTPEVRTALAGVYADMGDWKQSSTHLEAAEALRAHARGRR